MNAYARLGKPVPSWYVGHANIHAYAPTSESQFILKFPSTLQTEFGMQPFSEDGGADTNKQMVWLVKRQCLKYAAINT